MCYQNDVKCVQTELMINKLLGAVEESISRLDRALLDASEKSIEKYNDN